jgi:hypothetical protein
MSSAGRGAVVIGLAVIVGIIGLQILDDSGNDRGAKSASTTAPVSTVPGSTSTTSPTGRPLGQVRVKVYNASGITGQAQAQSDQLKAKGWNTLPVANLSKKRSGTTVECRSGFDKEGKWIAYAGVPGAKVQSFPSNPPDGSSDADCLVIIGTS